MSLYRDIPVGGRLEIDLASNHKLRLTDENGTKKVIVQLIYKRGNKHARLSIDAPDNVGVEVLPPDGVIIAAEGA